MALDAMARKNRLDVAGEFDGPIGCRKFFACGHRTLDEWQGEKEQCKDLWKVPVHRATPGG
jgi:hypothetical protein